MYDLSDVPFVYTGCVDNIYDASFRVLLYGRVGSLDNARILRNVRCESFLRPLDIYSVRAIAPGCIYIYGISVFGTLIPHCIVCDW